MTRARERAPPRSARTARRFSRRACTEGCLSSPSTGCFTLKNTESSSHINAQRTSVGRGRSPRTPPPWSSGPLRNHELGGCATEAAGQTPGAGGAGGGGGGPASLEASPRCGAGCVGGSLTPSSSSSLAPRSRRCCSWSGALSLTLPVGGFRVLISSTEPLLSPTPSSPAAPSTGSRASDSPAGVAALTSTPPYSSPPGEVARRRPASHERNKLLEGDHRAALDLRQVVFALGWSEYTNASRREGERGGGGVSFRGAVSRGKSRRNTQYCSPLRKNER